MDVRGRTMLLGTLALFAWEGCSLRSLEPLLCPADDPRCARDAGDVERDAGAGEVERDAALADAHVAAPEAALVLHYASVNPEALDDKQIRLRFAVQNLGRRAVPLSSLTIRYYFSTETGGSQSFACSSVSDGFGCDDVLAAGDVFAGEGANRVMVWQFAASAGTLEGDGTFSGELKGLIRNDDFSAFVQSDDYSFVADEELAPNARMTVHQDGVLVWGTPP